MTRHMVLLASVCCASLAAAAVLVTVPEPVKAFDCNDFSNWDKDEWWGHTEWHQAEFGNPPIGEGEWTFQGTVGDRQGVAHSQMEEDYAEASGEHPAC